MKITINELFQIAESINYLSRTQTKAWYAVLKNKRKIEKLIKEANEERGEIANKFALKDDKGEFVTKEAEGGLKTYTFNSDIEETAFKDAVNVWGKEEVEIEFYKTNIKTIIDESYPEILINPLLDKIFTEEDENKA